ncbi:hypothetical protein [Streptomyces albogriseolus]|uniref:hypothetical protein n=1 Tax=Streptomyces albogriseolus TaxID=1887 RepID=UPI0033A73005
MSHARSTAVLLLLAAAVGCTSEAGAPERPAPSPRSPSPPAATAGRSPAPRPSAPVAPPQLDSTAGAHGPARGNAAFRYTAGARGEALTVTVSCQGSGTLRIRIPVLRAAFPVECGIGEADATGADFDLPAAHRAGTVHVTAPPGVTWAATVGRGESAEPPPL